ncbi:hypothetical protein [Nonomuraea sp. NPDC005650]|uniref:hypothetical protein n=1 Tax=Nonomuraea sp. NPDC005650 TaxID=3157045 RepID=UPI0033B70D5E
MSLVNAELHALADLAAHDPETRALLHLDLKDFQLSVLRTAFQSWDIWYGLDSSGHWVWTARPHWVLTLETARAGVLPEVQRGDPIALMAVLATQQEIVQRLAGSRP